MTDKIQPTTDRCLQCGETFDIFNLLTVKCLHPYCAACASALRLFQTPCAICGAEILRIDINPAKPDLYRDLVETIQDLIGAKQADLSIIAHYKTKTLQSLSPNLDLLADIEQDALKLIQNIEDFEKILNIIARMRTADYATQITYFSALESRVYELEEVRSEIALIIGIHDLEN
jgi:hypothetical protein